MYLNDLIVFYQSNSSVISKRWKIFQKSTENNSEERKLENNSDGISEWNQIPMKNNNEIELPKV